jgi:hypothetical protein
MPGGPCARTVTPTMSRILMAGGGIAGPEALVAPRPDCPGSVEPTERRLRTVRGDVLEYDAVLVATRWTSTTTRGAACAPRSARVEAIEMKLETT